MKALCGTHFATAMLAVASTSPALAQARPLGRWKNEAALDDHVAAPASRAFREKLGPKSGALYDDRRYKNLE
jgi:hypothetical protein